MILVTGGSGLVGRELIAQLLLQGKPVRAIYNKTPLPNFTTGTLQQIQCNILDVVGLEEAMEGIELVYHCAAIVKFSNKHSREMLKVNIEGTANVVNAALDAGVQKMVHVSSVASLTKKKGETAVTESMGWNEETNHSAYSKSKYLSELEVWRGVSEGLNAVIVNPSIIIGAGDWNAGSSQIFKSVYDEFPWYSEGINGFVDVRDVAKAMIQLMDSEISGQRFILSAANKSYKDIFNLIATAFGKKAPHKKVTPLLAAIVWRLESIKSIFTGKAPLVTRDTATTALAATYYDNTKLIQAIPGFYYKPIEQTITDTCAAFTANL